MIDLTPLEVRQKKGDFRRAFRGYDPELVNDFLDLVADRMEELVKENLSFRDAADAVREEIDSYRQKEQALSDALMTAQKLRDDARQHAEKESELMLREAQLQAEKLRDEAARQLVAEQEALRQVRARRAQLVESFRRLLDREMSELDIIEDTLELDEPEPQPRPAAKSPAAAKPSPPADVPPPQLQTDDLPALEAEPAPDTDAGDDGDEGEGPVQEDWFSSLTRE